MYEFIVYEKPEDGIATIMLNRPESLNALHLPLVEELYAAADEAAQDAEVVVIVYSGAGRAFCAGRDFKYSAELQTKDPEGWFAWRKRFRGFGDQTWLHPKATIAQVHGYALGGGGNLAVHSDITIASEDARFGFPEARYGQLGGEATVWNWLMGPKKTKEFLLTGRNFSAREAYNFGLINHVVAREELEATTMSMARDIVRIERAHPGYVRSTKFQINNRHVDLMTLSVINPARAEALAYMTEFTMRSMDSVSSFYTDVAERGFHAAVDEMHDGYSSRE